MGQAGLSRKVRHTSRCLSRGGGWKGCWIDRATRPHRHVVPESQVESSRRCATVRATATEREETRQSGEKDDMKKKKEKKREREKKKD